MIEKLKGKRVLIIGDVCVDVYDMGQSTRLSPEAPVPVISNPVKEYRLGMAANVAANIKALGSEPVLISVTGADDDRIFRRLCLNIGIPELCIFREDYRITTTKTRIIANGQQLARLDHEHTSYIKDETENLILSILDKEILEADVVIVQDYGKGVLTRNLLKYVIEFAQHYSKKVIIDPNKRSLPYWYSQATLVTPNKQEAIDLDGGWADKTLDQRIQSIKKELYLDKVVITLGEDGIMGIENDKIFSKKAKSESVVDVTGAGDTVTAVLALGEAAGLSLQESCELANSAAAVVVRKLGTSTCSIEELKEEHENS